ncbi:NAD(P)/FAD-dependent oxidoreductase [Caballeronia sp. PC1]|nr:NAD(P)/FAD-dependent oxidoreductase [Caballeronia sp. PC1]
MTQVRNDSAILDAVVVGAGFGGLYAVKRLTDAGFAVQAFEAGDGVGGTWYWNRYPGARVDLECWDYSYSFSPELQDEWDWPERYPTSSELMKYLNHVADRFELRRHIRFNTRVETAVFDERENLWVVTTSDGKVTRARFFVPATGVLSVPKPPEIAGLDSFKGESYHTGRWPHHEVDFSNKRVGVIGTGSSGIQVIQALAGQCRHLSVFQRTAVYVVPAKNHPLTPEMRARVRATYPSGARSAASRASASPCRFRSNRHSTRRPRSAAGSTRMPGRTVSCWAFACATAIFFRTKRPMRRSPNSSAARFATRSGSRTSPRNCCLAAFRSARNVPASAIRTTACTTATT